jgi:hypothetical protein
MALLAGCGGDGDQPFLDGLVDQTTTTIGSGDPPATTKPTDQTTTTQPAPVEVWEFDEAMIEQALATAAATSPEDIAPPGRNPVATSLLTEEFAASGLDLTGLEIVVFPDGISESFVLMVSDDSTALMNTDDGSDLLVAHLLASPVVAQFAIETMILQHSTTDDEGPLILTFAVALSDLDEAVRTGADIFDRIAVQAERTS